MAFRHKALCCLVVITFAYIALSQWKSAEGEWGPGAFSLLQNEGQTKQRNGAGRKGGHKGESSKQSRVDVIDLLIEEGVYESNSFANEAGVVPPFWDENATSPCKPDETTTSELGPCFASHIAVDWHEQAQKNNVNKLKNKLKNNDTDTDTGTDTTDTQLLPRYTPLMSGNPEGMKTKNDWAGHCRPGFLIIGAGKCGTSSLYHYLTDHPRVIPAVEKQIHYFKYFPSRPMKWYLQHFPTTTSFLSSGALMTGEASPGYLPYPEVAQLVRERLARSGVKIITIGRDPIDRAYSSYRYSYVVPTLDKMRAGGLTNIPRNQPDAFYEPFLFTFQQMLEAELKQLQKCLAVPDGSAVAAARNNFGADPVWVKEFARRHREGLPPLATLGVECYGDGKTKSSTSSTTTPATSTTHGSAAGEALREQWVDLVRQFPDKVIFDNNVHLQQSLIGRSLYVIPLEWWYALFNRSDLYFVCTEELRDMTGEPLNRLGQFLGLPSYNFSSTVQKGAYNVGDNRGYDTETSWENFEAEQERGKNDNLSSTSTEGRTDNYSLTQEFHQELQDFIRPYNERLFQLIGRRCDWSA